MTRRRTTGCSSCSGRRPTGAPRCARSRGRGPSSASRRSPRAPWSASTCPAATTSRWQRRATSTRSRTARCRSSFCSAAACSTPTTGGCRPRGCRGRRRRSSACRCGCGRRRWSATSAARPGCGCARRASTGCPRSSPATRWPPGTTRWTRCWRSADVDPTRAIADAVLYEGYALWPYRRSALKNQRRWTFGGVYPPAHSACHPDDPAVMRTECLLRGGPEATLAVRVRFLHVVARRVGRAVGDGLELVDELEVAGERHLAWSEAAEREVAIGPARVGSVAAAGRRAAIDVPAGSDREDLRHPDGTRAGALLRSWHG